jgi:DNA modification methylase
MMYPRLSLLRDFLTEDGAIFISIDDNETSHLREIMDEIFGPSNFVSSIVWQRRTSPDARAMIGAAHDYIIIYARSISRFKERRVLLPMLDEQTKGYKNPDNDPRGAWSSVDMTAQTGHATPEQFYEVVSPNGKGLPPPKGRCWGYAEATFKALIADNRVWFGKTGNSRPRVKRFLSEAEGVAPWTWWTNREAGHNQEAKQELIEILGQGVSFDTPKPVRLLRRVLLLGTEKDSLVLDSFAGSGTTGHAMLELNKSDGGHRRFILVEMEEDVCRNVAAQRLSRAIKGFAPRGDEGKSVVEGLGGGFRYCGLGEALFDEDGSVCGTVRFSDLAAHVFFTETGTPIPKRASGKTPLLGEHNGKAIYLLFNGVLGDKSTGGGNVLTNEILRSLPEPTTKDGFKVIYGEGCRLGAARLKREGIVFKQVPYEIKVS